MKQKSIPIARIENPKEMQEKLCRKLRIGTVVSFIVSVYGLYVLTSQGESDTIFSYFGNLITNFFWIPLTIINSGMAISQGYRAYKYSAMSQSEWIELVRTSRPMLSLATYRCPTTGDQRQVQRGFSLPVFLFGVFVPLFRGQSSLVAQYLVIVIALTLVGSIVPVLGNIIGFFIGKYTFAFKYNNIYEDWLIDNGYVLVNIKLA